MKECVFKEICAEDPALKARLKQIQKSSGCDCPFTAKHPGCVNETTLLDAIRDGSLYGFVLASIKIPEVWSPEFEGRFTMSPAEYFGEMSPIFATCDVRREDVGPYMQQYMNDHGIRDACKRLLVGGDRAQNILVSTELARWYLNRGLIIHDIALILEFEKKAYLRDFCSDVTNARRSASKDPDKLILSQLQKLLGNSTYVKY